MIKGWHVLDGDWAIEGFEDLKVSPAKFVKDDMRIVKFSDFCHKPLPDMNCPNFNVNRYQNADPRFPGILAEGVPNPENKKYRMCDGRYRLLKMKNSGIKEALFIIINKKTFMNAAKLQFEENLT